MGLRDDPSTVVNSNLRVIGIDGLRVVDASVVPTIASGNIDSPTPMIAERAAEMMLQRGDHLQKRRDFEFAGTAAQRDGHLPFRVKEQRS